MMKRSWAGEIRNVSLLVASAVNSEGFREILGICEGAKEDKSGWSAFLRHIKKSRRYQRLLCLSDRRMHFRKARSFRRYEVGTSSPLSCPIRATRLSVMNRYERRARFAARIRYPRV